MLAYSGWQNSGNSDLNTTTASAPPHAQRISIVVPVYRGADRAIELVQSLQTQRLHPNTHIEIIVVDDGSNDGSADRMEESIGEQATVHKLPTNSGRAIARNAGARRADGELLLFIDSDCLPADAGFIAAHVQCFDADVVASTGPVVGTGLGFWHAFQVGSSTRRAALHEQGVSYSGSTQNLMVRRDAFEAVGGFEEGYRAYGFEDRDLLIRLAVLGLIAWADDAVVEHHDDLDLATVCRKMREAGAGSSSRIFATRHADAYRALGYAAVDARLHPARARLAKAGAPLLPFLIAVVSSVLEWRWIPFALRSLAVRALSGASYLLGTTEANDVQGG